MDEEFDRGGVTLARGVVGGPKTLATGQGSAESGNSPFAQAALWARKRRRASLGTSGRTDGRTTPVPQGWGTDSSRSVVSSGDNAAGAVNLIPTVGRESPDSDMSSGSDVSINRGIKRMRLDHHTPHQYLAQPPQQQQQLRQGTSAFGPYTPLDGRPTPTWNGPGSPESGVGHGMESAQGRGGGELVGVQQLRSATGLGGLIGEAAAGHRHHLSSSDRAVSDSDLFPPSEPIFLARSGSSSGGLEGGSHYRAQRPGSSGRAGDGPGASGAAFPGRNGSLADARAASFDTCAAFSPYAPQPPAQARYVKGIRVELNAPADVDYPNVNNALRQLHMERRMASTRAALGEGGRGNGNGPSSAMFGGGNGGRQWPHTFAWREG